jgi:hypothetical protein
MAQEPPPPDDERWRERPAPAPPPPPQQEQQAWYPPPRELFEFTPFFGYRYGGTIYQQDNGVFDFDTDVASDVNYGLNFGIPIGPTPMKLELTISQQQTNLTPGGGLFEPDVDVGDIDITYYHGGVQFPFGDPRGINPFFVFSAGIANLRPNLPNVNLTSETRFSMSMGFGVKFAVNRNLGFRLEGRGYWTDLGDYNGDVGCYGCYYYDYWGNDLWQGETNFGIVFSF